MDVLCERAVMESLGCEQSQAKMTVKNGLKKKWKAACLVMSDERLARRARKLVEQIATMAGASMPAACQDWANTKAAYRFFSNPAVTEQEILTGHIEATKSRMAAADDRVLVLHDTTSFTYQRDDASDLGELNHFRSKRGGAIETKAARGILMHSSLVITPEGLPLGLAAIKFWTRKEFKGCNALKKKINPTRVSIEEKESYRWLQNLRQATALAVEPKHCVHIGDRESDIYEFFCTAAELETHFLVRTCVDRFAGERGKTIAEEMKKIPRQGLHRIRFKDAKGVDCEAVLELKFQQIEVHPPIGKQAQYPSLALTVIHANERGTPKGREKIQWKLLTNLKVDGFADAVEKLDWYAQRWKIETFHKILKSGCKAEDSKLRTYERLTNFIALCCIVSWRIFWMTMLRRVAGDMPPSMALTEVEILLLDGIAEARQASSSNNQTLADYLLSIARLGGYLARAHDPPPGNIVMWRGLSRLTDIQLGFAIGTKLVGN
jgi:hypothetical protein